LISDGEIGRPIDRQTALRLRQTIRSVAHESDRDRTNYVVHSRAYIITCVFIVTSILNVRRKNVAVQCRHLAVFLRSCDRAS